MHNPNLIEYEGPSPESAHDYPHGEPPPLGEPPHADGHRGDEGDALPERGDEAIGERNVGELPARIQLLRETVDMSITVFPSFSILKEVFQMAERHCAEKAQAVIKIEDEHEIFRGSDRL